MNEKQQARMEEAFQDCFREETKPITLINTQIPIKYTDAEETEANEWFRDGYTACHKHAEKVLVEEIKSYIDELSHPHLVCNKLVEALAQWQGDERTE